jgi:uncharacterized membrane protein YvbJ
MYCSNCGSSLSQSTKFCGKCGSAMAFTGNQTAGEQPFTMPNKKPSLVGFSPKINDPAFDKYKKNSNRWAVIFSIILAVIAIIGFPIYGSISGELEMPYSLYYGLGIGGMFIVIAITQVISKSNDTTWDGVVLDKKIYKRSRWDKDTEMSITYTVYEYKVKRDNGKVYSHRNENNDKVYNYYSIGDRVRHHKGFYGYEKYDKSRETFLFCTACATVNDISNEICFRCKCPLLK